MAFILSKWLLLLSSMICLTNESPAHLKQTDLHPFHVSVTEIQHNGTEKTLQISCKFFTDDLEVALEKAASTAVDITSETEKDSLDVYIPDYVGKHLRISVGGKGILLNYIGYEVDKESVFCYFEVTNMAAVNSMDITNNLLYEFTHEQINIMHVTVNGKRQSSKLNYPEVKAGFKF